MYMPTPEAISNPEVDMHVKKMPDGDSVPDEQASTLLPEPLDLTFGNKLPNEVQEPKPGEPKDLVQKQRHNGVWRTLCNVCHQPVPASFESYCEDGDEDFGYDPYRTVCFEVTPCNVTIESAGFDWNPNWAAENWRKQKPRTFVVCAKCIANLGLVATQLTVTPPRDSGTVEEGDIRPDSVVEDSPDSPHLIADLHELEGLPDIE
jgi:hypothetical protein